MNVTCKDRERIFEDGTAAEWAALAAHAAACATCTDELSTWQSLSVAAKELRDYSPIPGLWSRIERALIEQDGRKARRPEGKWWFSFLPNVSLGWQTAVAGAFALILTASVTWIISRPVRDPGKQDPLLRNAARRGVGGAEGAYEKASERWVWAVRPQVDKKVTLLAGGIT